MDGKKRYSLSWKFFATLTTKKAIFIIVTLGIIVFSNSIFNNFVGDDASQIVDNTVVHSIKNILTFFGGSTFYNAGEQLVGLYYKPLLNTVFSFIYTLFGPKPYAFHLFQIILHILNTCLLFLFLKHFFKNPLSLILSLIFLVHPINSEAVFYISATQEPLFFFFGILALLILTRAESKKSLLFVGLFLFLSLLSKETGVLFLFISSAYAFIFNKKRFYLMLGISIVTLVLYLLLRESVVSILNRPLNAPIARLTLPERLLNMPEMFFFYLKTFILPLSLALSYHWFYTQITFNHFFLPIIADLLFMLVIFFFAIALYKGHRYKYFRQYLFFIIWFLLGMIFHLQIFPLDVTVTERWFYFSIVGLLGIMGILFEVFDVNFKNKFVYGATLLLISLLFLRTFVRGFDWRDELTLATHDIRFSPESYNLENTIGNELIKKGQFQEAKVHIERSIKLFPYATNYINLGVAYTGLADYQKAKEAYLKALTFGDYYLTYENLGALTLVNGDINENIKFLNDSLKKFPKDVKLWLYLAILEYKRGNSSEAKRAISMAYAYNQGEEISFFYQKIMNGQPFTLDFKVGQ